MIAEFVDIFDLSETLAAEYNLFCEEMLNEFEPFHPDDIRQVLQDDFYLEEMKGLIDSEYGRGIILGLVTAVIQNRMALEEEAALNEDEE